MRFPWSKAALPHTPCRDHAACTCAMDPDRIGKHVFIELSSACNLNCSFCAYSWSTRKGGFMPLPLLAKILADLKQLRPVDYLMFSALGEPTLHPEFGEACRMVKKAGYRLLVTTNGSRLNEEIRNLPIDELYISFNTPTPEAYALKRGKGPSFDDYVENLASFVQGVPLYDVYLYFLTQNLRDYPDAHGFVDTESHAFARRLEDLLRRIRPGIQVPVPIPKQLELYSNVSVLLKPLTLWVNENLPPHLSLVEATHIPGASCSYYKHHLNIIATGEVTICCGDADAALHLGNVRNETLRSIYLRKQPNTELGCNALCRKCKGRVVPVGGGTVSPAEAV
jgi:MoaA/NifB/PqqE/SkfB family radical SAM enzyme